MIVRGRGTRHGGGGWSQHCGRGVRGQGAKGPTQALGRQVLVLVWGLGLGWGWGCVKVGVGVCVCRGQGHRVGVAAVCVPVHHMLVAVAVALAVGHAAHGPGAGGGDRKGPGGFVPAHTPARGLHWGRLRDSGAGQQSHWRRRVSAELLLGPGHQGTLVGGRGRGGPVGVWIGARVVLTLASTSLQLPGGCGPLWYDWLRGG